MGEAKYEWGHKIKPNYQKMDFTQMTFDPVAEPILQLMALRWLQTGGMEDFNQEFTGELDREGNLIRKDGTVDRKPSELISDSEARKEITEMTRKELLTLEK